MKNQAQQGAEADSQKVSDEVGKLTGPPDMGLNDLDDTSIERSRQHDLEKRFGVEGGAGQDEGYEGQHMMEFIDSRHTLGGI